MTPPTKYRCLHVSCYKHISKTIRNRSTISTLWCVGGVMTPPYNIL